MAKAHTYFRTLEVYKHFHDHVYDNMGMALEMQKRYCQALISRPNPTGKDPSKPGEAPKMVTGRLRASIKTTRRHTKDGVRGYLYSDVPYALFLEEGTMRIEPRPFLSRTMEETKAAAYKILTRPDR